MIKKYIGVVFVKKSRILSLVTALVLVGCLFSGCGKKNDDSNVTTISVWSPNSHSKTIVTKLVDNYNETEGKKKGIAIDYKIIEGDAYAQSLELAMQTGQGPDLVDSATLKLKSAVENGYVTAFEDIEGGMDTLKKLMDTYNLTDSDFMEFTHKYKNKIYAIPENVTTRALIYNKDMFKKAGLVDEKGEPVPPETFDELREYAKKLTNKAENKFGIIFPMKWSGWVGSDIVTLLESSVGHNGFNPVTGEYDYSGMAPIINAYMGMIEDNSVYPGSEGIDNDTARAYFAEGMVGMKIAYSFDVGVLNDQFPAKCDWGVAPLPVIDKNHKYLQRQSVGASFAVNTASIPSKGADKLLEVVSFFAGKEMATELYKHGASLPYKWDMVKDVELGSDAKKGWKEFAELAAISAATNPAPQADMTGFATLPERVINDVFSGKVSAEDMVKQYNADMTAGTKKYYEVNGNEYDSLDMYINKDWNIER